MGRPTMSVRLYVPAAVAVPLPGLIRCDICPVRLICVLSVSWPVYALSGPHTKVFHIFLWKPHVVHDNIIRSVDPAEDEKEE